MKKNYIKTQQEIEIINEGGKLLRDILLRTAKLVKPGITTEVLNTFAEQEIFRVGGRPSFVGYGSKRNPYPSGLCTSINDAVVHGIPSERDFLREGDIIGLDIGMEYKGLFTDTAITVPVGKISLTAQKLIEVTKKALDLAIRESKPGNKIGDIGAVIQATAEDNGFSTVKDLVGHGVGYAVHEDPSVPGYGKKGTGMILEPGLVIAIEPMFCQKKAEIYFDEDGWTIRTQDGGLAAHFEHTIVITENGSKILT